MRGRFAEASPWRRLLWACSVLALWAVGATAVSSTESGAVPGAEAVVLKDGQEVEIVGGFEIKGRMVVFTDEEGNLRSIPLRDVDVEASRATEGREEARERVEGADNRQRDTKPILVLEDRDVPQADEAQRKRALAAEARRQKAVDQAAQRTRARQGNSPRPKAAPQSSASTEGTTAGLAVVSHWKVQDSQQTRGIQIVGEVSNPSEKNLDRVTVKLKLYDDRGKLVKTGRAFVDRTRLSPGLATNFRYLDPGLESLVGLTVEFQVTARVLSWGSRPRILDEEDRKSGDNGR
ncbi:MAG: FxLYD domain-containing protein [Thermoanaerobaculia bacterium]|nr:FxLYD domain-containing protein [Thermoanaerobaculia bacterium]